MPGEEPELTPLVSSEDAIVRQATLDALARNWAWIGIFGIFNLAVGTACLIYPVLASQVVELALTYTIFVSAAFHFVSACFSEEGSTLELLTMGTVQLLIAFIMFFHPYGVLTVLTFFIAIAYMSAGSYMIFYAKNGRTAARGLTMFSGFLAVLLSFIILVGLPTTSWFTVGILIGVNHVNIGVSRIVMAFYGFRLSRIERGDAQNNSADEVITGWMA